MSGSLRPVSLTTALRTDCLHTAGTRQPASMKRTIKSALAATFLIAAASTAVGSPLHLYTRMGDSKTVHRYLDNGYDPNVREVDGEGLFTPLHEAAFRGTAKIAELLLRHGAEVDAPVVGGDTPFGFTALHIAAAAGSHAVAEVLLEHGADPNAVANDGERIFTPLSIASGLGYERMADLLRKHGATD